MNITVVTPAPMDDPGGNTTTVKRWRAILRRLGHRVQVLRKWDGEPSDLLVALHARKSHASIKRYRGATDSPIILALTGTDVYGWLPRQTKSTRLRYLRDAARIIVLQPLAVAAIPRELRTLTRVVYQSVRPGRVVAKSKRTFDVAVLANLRKVKDPLRAAYAVRSLPQTSRLRVVHAGVVLTEAFGRRAAKEATRNQRYRFVGPVSSSRARALLGRSRVLVVSSIAEGGANVVGEAVIAGVPVIATRIPGNLGLLGDDYPGYYEVGDTQGLRELLLGVENDRGFRRLLAAHCRRLRRLFAPSREVACWRKLLSECQEPRSL